MSAGGKNRQREAFLPLFFGDFLSATGEWEGEEQGLYLLLLGYQWSKGSIPADPRKICKLTRWDWGNFERYWGQVEEKFPLIANVIPADGERHKSAKGARRQNARLEEIRAKAATLSAKNSDSGKKGAEARWGKKDGETIANAIPADGERHESASGEPYGATDIIPIQSNPIHKKEQESARDVPRGTNTPEVTRAGAVCVAMKAEGMIDVSPAHPVLLELLKAGAEIGEFVDAARRAVADGKRFAYALAIVRGRRADAAKHAVDAAPVSRGDQERAELERLKAKRAEMGIPDFREPHPGVEPPAAYETAMRLAARDQRSASPRPVTELTAALAGTAGLGARKMAS